MAQRAWMSFLYESRLTVTSGRGATVGAGVGSVTLTTGFGETLEYLATALVFAGVALAVVDLRVRRRGAVA